MTLVEFDDEDGASSSDMDEYESEDELGDMFCSPRNLKHKKPQPAKTSGQIKPKTKPHKTAATTTTSSKPQQAKPPVASKPVKSSIAKPSTSAGTTDSVKPSRTTRSDDVGSFLGMKEYMDAMDRELARTTVGKSFVREGDEVGFLCASSIAVFVATLSTSEFCHRLSFVKLFFVFISFTFHHDLPQNQCLG